jgi:hypothetical protein
MTCRLCKDRGKTWEGSDPRCAFLETTELMTTENEPRSAKVFSVDNLRRNIGKAILLWRGIRGAVERTKQC